MSKFIFLAIIAVLSVFSAAGAAEIIVGGTDGSINIPFCGGCYTSSHNQSLVLASELGGSGTIEAIAYNFDDTTGAGAFYGFEMKLCHTTVAALSDNFNNNYAGKTPVVIVPSVTLNMPDDNGWIDMPDFSPFDYNGDDNLIIELKWSGSNSESYDTFYGNSGVARNMHAASDTAATGNPANYTLNTKITITYIDIESTSLGAIKAVYR